MFENFVPARPHHYTFAHQALPAFCGHDPRMFFGVMVSDDKDTFINFMWDQVCKSIDNDILNELTVADFEFHVSTLGVYPIVFIEMPKAIAPTEAIFVAVVLLWKADGTTEGPEEDVKHRYILLEKASSGTMLCEWANGSHVNLGAGPAPEPSAFLHRVADLVGVAVT